MRILEKWRRRSRISKWVLLGVTAGMTVILTLFVIFISGFLAVNSPVGEGVLVVEGWIPARTLAESVTVFNSGRYRYLAVVGGPMRGSGSKSVDPTTYADVAASRLEELGFDRRNVVKINVPAVSFGRTFAGAREVERWLGSSGVSVCCVDVFTAGVHARKSWMLFRYALGDGYRVGIIAGFQDSYNRRLWLVSRRGIWLVSRNVVGCAYSKLWILLHGKCQQTEFLLSRPQPINTTPATAAPSPR